MTYSKTDANLLKSKKIGIWDGNSSREYLDSLGLTQREEGDLGPVYGTYVRAAVCNCLSVSASLGHGH